MIIANPGFSMKAPSFAFVPNKKAKLAGRILPSAARPSSTMKIRRFPSLPCGRFGFVGISSSPHFY
jgi:hypothetical protein